MFPVIGHSVLGEDGDIILETLPFYGCASASSPPPLVTVQESPNKGGTRTKQQKCTVCGKILASASSYYVHMKLHSGHKPYQCTQCDAAFSRKPYLEVSFLRVTRLLWVIKV